jgi:hypothetical protein
MTQCADLKQNLRVPQMHRAKRRRQTKNANFSRCHAELLVLLKFHQVLSLLAYRIKLPSSMSATPFYTSFSVPVPADSDFKLFPRKRVTGTAACWCWQYSTMNCIMGHHYYELHHGLQHGLHHGLQHYYEEHHES